MIKAETSQYLKNPQFLQNLLETFYCIKIFTSVKVEDCITKHSSNLIVYVFLHICLLGLCIALFDCLMCLNSDPQVRFCPNLKNSTLLASGGNAGILRFDCLAKMVPLLYTELKKKLKDYHTGHQQIINAASPPKVCSTSQSPPPPLSLSPPPVPVKSKSHSPQHSQDKQEVLPIGNVQKS